MLWARIWCATTDSGKQTSHLETSAKLFIFAWKSVESSYEWTKKNCNKVVQKWNKMNVWRTYGFLIHIAIDHRGCGGVTEFIIATKLYRGNIWLQLFHVRLDGAYTQVTETRDRELSRQHTVTYGNKTKMHSSNNRKWKWKWKCDDTHKHTPNKASVCLISDWSVSVLLTWRWVGWSRKNME